MTKTRKRHTKEFLLPEELAALREILNSLEV